jgi:hypothetical protein
MEEITPESKRWSAFRSKKPMSFFGIRSSALSARMESCER